MKIPINIYQIKQTFLKYHNNRKTGINDHSEWLADVVNNMLQVMFTPLVDKLLDYEIFSWLTVSCSPYFSDIKTRNSVRFRVEISLRNSDVRRIILRFKWAKDKIYFISGIIKIDKGEEKMIIHVKSKTSI